MSAQTARCHVQHEIDELCEADYLDAAEDMREGYAVPPHGGRSAQIARASLEGESAGLGDEADGDWAALDAARKDACAQARACSSAAGAPYGDALIEAIGPTTPPAPCRDPDTEELVSRLTGAGLAPGDRDHVLAYRIWYAIGRRDRIAAVHRATIEELAYQWAHMRSLPGADAAIAAGAIDTDDLRRAMVTP